MRRRVLLAVAMTAMLAAPAIGFGQANFRRGQDGLEPNAVRLTPSPADRAALAQALRASPGGGEGSAAVLAARGLDPALVRRSPVPVLIPDLAGVPAQLYLAPDAQPQAYAATLESPGQSVVIFGSAKAFVPPPGSPAIASDPADAFGNLAIVLAYRAAHPGAPPPNPETLPQNVHIARTEFGMDIAFTQFGAPYDISLACADPQGDPRCSQAAAMLLLVKLLLVGGGSGW